MERGWSAGQYLARCADADAQRRADVDDRQCGAISDAARGRKSDAQIAAMRAAKLVVTVRALRRRLHGFAEMRDRMLERALRRDDQCRGDEEEG